MSTRWLHLIHIAGLFATVLGARLAFTKVIGPARFNNPDATPLPWWLALAGLMVAASYGLGLPEQPRSRASAFFRAVGAVGIGFAVLSLAQLTLAQALLPRSSLVLIAIITPIFAILSWRISSDLHSWSASRDRVLMVTSHPDNVAALRADLHHRDDVALALVDVIHADELNPSEIGATPLADRVRTAEATLLVIDKESQGNELLMEQVAAVHRTGVRVRTLSLFYEEWLGKLPPSELAQVSLLFDIGEVHRNNYARAKRVVDIGVGFGGVVACALLIPAVAMVNLVANPGPLFFTQERVGKDGKPFRMIKFRTMLENTHASDQLEWTAIDDDRITDFGKLLRTTHLDELPQMINILRGELSIVGPRPEQVHYVEELRRKIPFYDDRHIVRPGLTGWAQVKQGYAASEDDSLEKLQYDFYYLRRQSIAFDLSILGRTLREVLGGLGR